MLTACTKCKKTFNETLTRCPVCGSLLINETFPEFKQQQRPSLNPLTASKNLLRPCPTCGKQVSEDAGKCPNCGAHLPTKAKQGCAIIILIIFFLYCLGLITSHC